MIDDPLASEDPGDADAALAGEHALRLLDPEQEAACAEREARDPGFAALVAAWRSDLGGLDRAFRPMIPPARVQERIEARLFGTGRPSWLARTWASAGLWRAAAAVAALAALWLGLQGAPPPPIPGLPDARLVSAIASVEGDVDLLAWIEPEAAVLTVNRTGGEPAPGRAFELWLIEEGADPVSLGVLPEEARARLPLPRELAGRIAPGATLAVSDEPAGGSPGPGPSGPVVAAGPVSDI